MILIGTHWDLGNLVGSSSEETGIRLETQLDFTNDAISEEFCWSKTFPDAPSMESTSGSFMG